MLEYMVNKYKIQPRSRPIFMTPHAEAALVQKVANPGVG